MYIKFRTEEILSSCINQKHVLGKWCYSRGNVAIIIFTRNKCPQEQRNLPTNSGVPNMFLNSFPKSILWASPKSMILIRGLGTFLSKSIMFSGLKKRKWYSNVHSSIIYNNQTVEKSQCSSTEEWINKMWSIHITNYYSAVGRK